MWKNYLKITFRNLIRKKTYSLINILGLSIGFICVILLFLYVRNELSYDQYHEKHERIYRIESHFNIKGKDDFFALSPAPLGRNLTADFPEIETFTRFRNVGKNLFTIGEKQFWENEFLWADSTVFDVFTHKVIKGSLEKSLSEPLTCVLTESTAKKWFGDEDPIGKVVDGGHRDEYTITAVIEDVPDNSHISFDGLISTEILVARMEAAGIERNQPISFWNVSLYTFLLIKENADVDNIMKGFPQFYEKHMAEIGRQINTTFDMTLTPLADVHLNDRKLSGDYPTGNMVYIYVFILVGLFIIIIASINYMNMSTAFSGKRAREVGMRKVCGANKKALVTQFLIESVIISFISFIIAFAVSYLLLPWFSSFTGKELSFSIFSQPLFAFGLIAFTLFIGLLSGSYPAFYLSAFSPSSVLKGEITRGKKGGNIRKILVVAQFAISIFMIVGTLIVTSQLSYIRNKPLGYNKENIITTTLRDSTAFVNLKPLREELLKNPIIKEVTLSTGLPVEENGILIFHIEDEEEMVEKSINFFYTANNYVDFMEMEIVKGQNFDTLTSRATPRGIVINETAVREFGWTDDPIGKRIELGMDRSSPGFQEMEVIGVVKDFHYKSLHGKIEPLLLIPTEFTLSRVSIKYDPLNTPEVLAFVEEKWKEFNPFYPFEYSFLEDKLINLYKNDQKVGTIFGLFAIISITVSCLGLFGLSSFMAEQRQKEIGIRKVLGASVSDIVVLFVREFSKWIIVANIIAAPFAYYFLNNWLENFSYRTNIHFGIFFYAAGIALFIAIFTVSFQAIKAAIAKPAIALKYE